MRRQLNAVALVVATLAIASGVAVWSYRADFLGWEAIRLIERQGLGPAQLTIDAVDLHGLHAHDVALRGGAVRANALTATYNPLELAGGHLGRVEIAGLDVALALGKDGIELGGRPLGTGASGAEPLGGWRVDALAFPDARISLESADGAVEAAVSATFVLAEDDVHSTAFSAAITVPVGAAHHALRISAQRLALQPQAGGGARLSVTQAAVTPEDLPWTAQQIDGTLVWQADRATAQLAIGQVVNRQQPMLVAPISVSGRATLIGPRIDFSLHAEAGVKATARLEAKGQHDRSSNSGSGSIVLDPIVFHRGSFQPADLIPALGRMVEEVEGSVALSGSLRWSGDTMSPDLMLRLNDLSFATSGARIRALNGAINVTKLWPPATPPGQALAATIEAAGLPPAKLSLRGQLSPKQALKLERIEVAVAGGEIIASPFAIDPLAPEIDSTVQVDHVDLAEITKLLSIEGLSGTGQLDGHIPISVKSGTVTISAGKLAARGPGVLRYQPDKLPPEIAAAGESVELALQALSAFHYDSLALDLDKSAGGEGTVLLRLQGRNPAVLSGQLFHFNIRIDSNFDRLADYALLSLSSAQELLRQAARRVGR